MDAKERTPLKIILLSALAGILFTSTANAIGDYMSFGLATGNYTYNVLDFEKASAKCYSNEISNEKLLPGKHIMCNVLYKDLGTFSITVQRQNTNMKCTIRTTKDTDTNSATKKKYVIQTSCHSMPGVVIVDQDIYRKKFKYGDWQVNLQ